MRAAAAAESIKKVSVICDGGSTVIYVAPPDYICACLQYVVRARPAYRNRKFSDQPKANALPSTLSVRPSNETNLLIMNMVRNNYLLLIKQ